jgi:hypothetical protein
MAGHPRYHGRSRISYMSEGTAPGLMRFFIDIERGMEVVLTPTICLFLRDDLY